MVKLAVVAVLATMLVRFPWFRRILLTEKRDWPERLVFAASLGLPLTAGVVARLLLNYKAADLTLSGLVPRRAARRSLRRRHRRGMIGIPADVRRRMGRPALRRSAAASPAAACASSARRKRSGTSRRSSSPTSTATCGGWCGGFRSTGSSSCSRRRSPRDPRQALGHDSADPIFYPADARRHARSAWLARGLVVFATVLCVAIPIKIWNSARIEHRLQEQEKLLMAARLDALASQINPHFLFNTLTSISSLIRSQPETARTLIVKLSGAAAPAAAQPGALRHAARGARSDRRVPRHRGDPLRPAAHDREVDRPGHPRPHRAEHAAAAAGRELDQARPVAQARRRPHHHPQPASRTATRSSTSSTTASASRTGNAERAI